MYSQPPYSKALNNINNNNNNNNKYRQRINFDQKRSGELKPQIFFFKNENVLIVVATSIVAHIHIFAGDNL